MGLFGDRERLLTGREIALIRDVFKTTDLPPLYNIRIRDGLSPTGTPFTDSDYSIMVGPKLFDGDLAQDDPDTLVHEMVHVWQYKQGTLTRKKAIAIHAIASMAEKFPSMRFNRNAPPTLISLPNPHAVEDLYYEYRKRIGDPWKSFTFESQAQLVEDWFSQYGDKKSKKTDRFVYVERVLYSGDPIAQELTLAELKRHGQAPDPPDPSEIREVFRQVSSETDHFLYFSKFVDRRLAAGNAVGIVARFDELEVYCTKLRSSRQADAIRLAKRLEARNDSLAQAFHYRLSTPTRERVLKLLKGLA